MKALVTIFLSVISCTAFSQEKVRLPDPVEAHFPGDLNAYIKQNLHYPSSVKKDGIQGRVVIRFTVSETGKIDSAEITRGFQSQCDSEALRIVRSMPKWNPAMENQKPISSKMSLPISFSLSKP